MNPLHSLSFRLALVYIGLFCTSVAVLMGLYYWVSVVRPTNEIKVEVSREAKLLSQIYEIGGDDALVAELRRRSVRPNKRMAFHVFIDKRGHVAIANLPSWPKIAARGWLEIEADVHLDGDETDHNALVKDQVFKDGARLIVGRDSEDLDDREQIVATAAVWIICGTLLLGMAGGLLMSRAIRMRIDAVNTAARTVMRGDLSGRVPVRGTGDDFDRLGETLNLMLSRIEDLFEAVRRVSDNVAHELRTPLSRLLVRLERLSEEAGDSAQDMAAREAVAQALEEARRLQRIFNALLRISRIEGQRNLIEIRDSDVSSLVADVAEFHEPAATVRSINLHSDIVPDLRADVDVDLIFQALSNLLDNALKYTPIGGKIELRASQIGNKLLLTVSDNGPGLKAEDRDRVTERFYRGAASRQVPGEGLGLSLVAAIAQQHGAELVFRDNDPGLSVELIIELRNPDAAMPEQTRRLA